MERPRFSRESDGPHFHESLDFPELLPGLGLPTSQRTDFGLCNLSSVLHIPDLPIILCCDHRELLQFYSVVNSTHLCDLGQRPGRAAVPRPQVEMHPPSWVPRQPSAPFSGPRSSLTRHVRSTTWAHVVSRGPGYPKSDSSQAELRTCGPPGKGGWEGRVCGCPAEHHIFRFTALYPTI